ncbi:MAG: hypothetical protein WDN76_01235 [Alphaproteobacteria bacterium]
MRTVAHAIDHDVVAGSEAAQVDAVAKAAAAFAGAERDSGSVESTSRRPSRFCSSISFLSTTVTVCGVTRTGAVYFGELISLR